MMPSELTLRTFAVHEDRTRFVFLLSKPAELTEKAVISSNISYEGHQWFLSCKTNEGSLAVYLGRQAGNNECSVFFSIALVCKTTGDCQFREEQMGLYLRRDDRHGFSNLAKVDVVLDPVSGFCSDISNWIEIELTMWKCKTTALNKSYVPRGDDYIAMTTVVIGDCHFELRFSSGLQKRRNESAFVLECSDNKLCAVKLDFECECVVQGHRFFTRRVSKSFAKNSKKNNEKLLPTFKEDTPTTSDSVTTLKIDIFSFAYAPIAKLTYSPHKTRTDEGTFSDGFGTRWSLCIQSVQAKKILSLVMKPSSLCERETVLLLKGAFISRKKAVEPLPLNNDKIIHLFTSAASRTEFFIDTLLEPHMLNSNTSPFFYKHRELKIGFEILCAQQNVLSEQQVSLCCWKWLTQDTRVSKKETHELQEKLDLEKKQHSQTRTELETARKDRKDARKSCKDTEDALKNIKNRLQKEQERVKAESKVVDTKIKEITKLQKEHEKTREKLRSSEEKLERMKGEFDRQKQRLKSSQSSLGESSNKVQDLTEENKELLEKMSKLESQMAQLTRQIMDMSNNNIHTDTRTQGTQVEEAFIDRPESQPRHPNKIVKEKDLSDLARKLGSNWKPLAFELGLDGNFLEKLDDQYKKVYDKIFHMLQEWKKVGVGRHATIGNLVEALKKVGESYDTYKFLLEI